MDAYLLIVYFAAMTLAEQNRAGRWALQQSDNEPFKAFIPSPLPPNPPISIDSEMQDLLEKANRALGRLDGMSTHLPDPHLFLYSYVRKEAVLSSQIEGTQSSLSDLLLYENKEEPGVPLADVKEVSNYVAALEHGLRRIRGGFPLSLRLIKEIHERLLHQVRGGNKSPGDFRRTQNWIGGSRPGNAVYVPPPPQEVMSCMGALEKFLHGDPVSTPTLIKAGLVHAQFESIHPFLDGNGRLGRLLITLILCTEGALSQPLLYLSLYFKEHRRSYYECLQKVREQGGWEDWMKFFFRGVEDVAIRANETADKIYTMIEKHRQKIFGLGKAATSALQVHDLFKRRIILSLKTAQRELGVTFPTVNHAMQNLQKLKLVKELTGKARDRVFSYHPLLKLMTEGTEEPVT